MTTPSLDAKISELKLRAKNGDSTAPYRLGKLYGEAGRGEEDLRESFKWYSKAAKIDCVPSYFELGNLCLKGVGTRLNRRKGFELMLLSGKKYDLRAFFPLYELYLNDSKDQAEGGKEAFLWLYRAAETSDSRAYLPLGKWILRDHMAGGKPDDRKEAARWLMKAQEDGSGEASFILASMYENGDAVEKDPNKAFRHMKKAAGQGHPESHLPLAKMCLERSAEDGSLLEKAVRHVRKAVKENVPEAAYLLGLIHGSPGGHLNPQLAFFFIKKAASMNFPPAMLELSALYESGKGVKPDPRRAFSLAKKAAKAGYRPAMLKLSELLKAEGARRDQEARKWLDLAKKTEDNALSYEGL